MAKFEANLAEQERTVQLQCKQIQKLQSEFNRLVFVSKPVRPANATCSLRDTDSSSAQPSTSLSTSAASVKPDSAAPSKAIVSGSSSTSLSAPAEIKEAMGSGGGDYKREKSSSEEQPMDDESSSSPKFSDTAIKFSHRVPRIG